MLVIDTTVNQLRFIYHHRNFIKNINRFYHKINRLQRCYLIHKPLREISGNRVTCTQRRYLSVIGFETSCDDSGVGIVNEENKIVANALHNGASKSFQFGGVIPQIAKLMHEDHISEVTLEALNHEGGDNLDKSIANTPISVEKDIDVIAATVRPGLLPCIRVGLKAAFDMARKFNKPFVAVDHMEAHALTARLSFARTHQNSTLNFPFLVLLASGGHCLLAVAEDVNKFLLLGRCIDSAPGEVFDKVARRLKLVNLPECYHLSAGAAVEYMASKAHTIDIDRNVNTTDSGHGESMANSRSKSPQGEGLSFLSWKSRTAMAQHHNCDFSFGGIMNMALKTIEESEKKFGVFETSEVTPDASLICSTLQYHIMSHMAKRIQRALIYCTRNQQELLPEKNRTLILSGGVARNGFIRRGIGVICCAYDTQLHVPPPSLCSDNGVMIAWLAFGSLHNSYIYNNI